MPPAVLPRGLQRGLSGFLETFSVLARQEEKQPSPGSPSRRGRRAGSFHGSPGAGDSEEKGLEHLQLPADQRTARIVTVQ